MKAMRLEFVFFLACALLTVGNGARILVVFPMGAYSHFTLGFTLAKELAARGHDVTFINAYPQKTPIRNLKDISVAGFLGKLDEIKKKYYDIGQLSYLGQLHWASTLADVYTEDVLKNKKVQELLKSGENFDVVVMEHLFNEALTIFSYKFNCPLVLLAPGPTTVFNNHLFANPSPSSYVPNFLTSFGPKMTLWERLKNTYYDILGQLYVYNVLLPKQDEILKRLVPGAPDLANILYNASLLLLTTHVSIRDPVPMQPNIKEIGGYHVGPLKPLPQDLREFLDEAKEGVIVFSMGSNLNSSDFPPKKKEAVIRVFSRLKQRVLWKFEGDLLEKPNNVKIMSWLPQQEVLAHPNVILFITHVGMLGTIEAVYHGVPLLGLPILWDQKSNIENVVRKEFGLKILFRDLNEQNFEWAVNELVNNPKYRNNAKLRSRIMHDQPMKPMDEAVYWIEYVIRHKGAPHLRSAGLGLKWYQRYLVDIIFVLILVSLTVFTTLRFICRTLFNKSTSKKEKLQ